MHDLTSSERIRYYATLRPFFLDKSADPRRAALLFSSPRSGSTLLAEVLAAAPGIRLIYEPFRPGFAGRQDLGSCKYLEPGTQDAALEADIGLALSGSFRSPWTDQYSRCRIARGRLIKDIRVNCLAPWIQMHFPTPLVFLLRHPLAVARSLTALGWDVGSIPDDHLTALTDGPLRPWGEHIETWARSPLGAVGHAVMRWCLENVVPLTSLDPERTAVVFYEDLMRRPQEELDRLVVFLRSSTPGLWGDWQPSEQLLSRSSKTDWRRGRLVRRRITAAERLAEWHQTLGTEDRDQAAEVLRTFGISRLYSDQDLYPQCGPEEVLRP